MSTSDKAAQWDEKKGGFSSVCDNTDKLEEFQRAVELYRSEERYAYAMRSADDGLWDWNLETDEVYYSSGWTGMLGYDAEELNATLDTWASLVHPDDKAPVLEAVNNYLSDAAGHFEVEMRMRHKRGYYLFVRSRAFKVVDQHTGKPTRLIGTHVDISKKKKAEILNERTNTILEMIAMGRPAREIYDQIALLYESRNPGMRCSMLELDGNRLMHGGAPSLPKAYCDAVNGLVNGPDVGSCGTSTYTGKRVLVENIETDPKWALIKDAALPHGMRCCWSEPIINSAGKVLGAFGMYYDYPSLPNEEESQDLHSAAQLASIVMERDQNQKKIKLLAYTDELTGLASRAYFFQKLDEQTRHSRRNAQHFSVLYVDLDNFKQVNDSFGHDAGDMLLKTVALRLQRVCRDSDTISRLSGDEFCILMEDTSDAYSAAKLAERCLEHIAQPIKIGGRNHQPTVSIGIANYPADGESASALLKAADTALYECKSRGRNQVAFYDTEMTVKAEQRFFFEQCLREAIEDQQLFLAYQPQFDLVTGQIIGVETLARWTHPVLGAVAPSEFIAVAERIGMIQPLTEWVLAQACRQAGQWAQEAGRVIPVAVNISPSHFLEQQFPALISEVLRATGVAAANLKLEVTEGVVQTDINNLEVFQALKQLGVTLAIDDFGTGYSSFASLKHLHVDYLKIDKYFINDLLRDEPTRVLVRSMIEMGHNLGYKIIAEGIEESAQLECLKSLACDIGQGYLYSKPVAAAEISSLLQR